jgi:hypothetical protein
VISYEADGTQYIALAVGGGRGRKDRRLVYGVQVKKIKAVCGCPDELTAIIGALYFKN